HPRKALVRSLAVVKSDRLNDFVEMVDRRLAELLPPEGEMPTDLHDAMRYSALAPGKRLRPMLAMAACEAVGAAAESAVDFG
ncbi:hypothetical protein ABTM96_20380, partial [Acinetobacter baumannii]